MGKEISAGAIIYMKNRKTKYLLLQYGLGHWGFVKGNIEKNEEIKQTIIRETEEETGITDLEFVDGFKERESYIYKLKGKLISKEVIYLLAKTNTEEIKLSFEHQDYKWLAFDEALKYLKFKNAIKMLTKANEILHKDNASLQKRLIGY